MVRTGIQGVLCYFLMGILVLAACRIGPKFPHEMQGVDTSGLAVLQARDTGQHFTLKTMQIDAGYLFPDGEQVRGMWFGSKETELFKPAFFDEFHTQESVYYLVDTIASDAIGSIYLLVKFDLNETSGWLVIYDQEMRVQDQIEVYYENAEGNFYLTTQIVDNLVITTGDNIVPEEEPVSTFKTDGLRWAWISNEE